MPKEKKLQRPQRQLQQPGRERRHLFHQPFRQRRSKHLGPTFRWVDLTNQRKSRQAMCFSRPTMPHT